MGSAQNIVTLATVAQMSPAFLQIIDMISAFLRLQIYYEKLDVVRSCVIDSSQLTIPVQSRLALKVPAVHYPTLVANQCSFSGKADVLCPHDNTLNHYLICINASAESLGFAFYERWRSRFIGVSTWKYFFTVLQTLLG